MALRTSAGTNGEILLLLDEAQWLYGKEHNFWCAIKMLHRRLLPISVPGMNQTRTLHVVMATSYLCAPAAFAGACQVLVPYSSCFPIGALEKKIVLSTSMLSQMALYLNGVPTAPSP